MARFWKKMSNDNGPNRETRIRDDQFVYVMPNDLSSVPNDEVDLIEIWSFLWQRKWRIAAVTLLFTVISVVYALIATEWYRAEVLLVPVEQSSAPSLDGQLGGLAALAGVSVTGNESVEAVATLESREFARAFIDEFHLLPVFFAEDWDADEGQWFPGNSEEWPDIRDGVEFFHENVLDVREDNKTDLVTLAVEWTDPKVAAEWADELVRRLNDRQRKRALLEAEANVAYLQSEMAKVGVIALQQSIGRLLENELQKVMLARGNEEYSFRVIDGAVVQKEPEWPNRMLVITSGAFLGALLAIMSLLINRTISRAIRDRATVE